MKSKIVAFLSLALFFETVHADVCDPCTTSEDNCCESQNWFCGDFHVTGEFLYWQPKISGLPYAASSVLTDTPLGFPLANDVDYQYVKFGFEPGFRIGLGYSLPSTDWDFAAIWTHFDTTATDTLTATPGRIISTFWEQLGSVFASTADSSLNVYLQSVDLDIGKTLEFYGCFNLHPFFGVSYYQLHINDEINYYGIVPDLEIPAEAHILLQDHSQGWGLNIGTDSLWQLPCGFGLYGIGKYFIFASQNSNMIVQRSVAPDFPFDLTLTTFQDFFSFSQMLKVGCGISWDYEGCVCSCPISLNLFAGYEFNFWPGQLELNRPQFGGSVNGVIPLESTGDVGFQGLTVGANLTF